MSSLFTPINFFYPIVSFIICVIATPVVRGIARKKGWMAQPTKDRWHKKPTALMGGIALYLGIAVPLLFVSDFSSILPHFLPNSGPTSTPSIGASIWIGITFLFVMGLIDDFRRIKPYSKLVGQILTASLIAFLGYRLHWLTSMTLDTTLTILWIVGITNAFNLLDNMDGLCTGIGAIAALYLALLLGWMNPDAAVVATLMFGSLAAFLIYNSNPASIFMGDSGSLIIGFTAAVLSLCVPEAGTKNRLASFAVPIMLMMVPIFDTSLVTLIRILSGRKASVGGKDHTSHRLVLMGFSERRAVLFLYGIGIIAGLSAVFVSRQDTLTSPVVIIPICVSFILMGIYLAQLRVYPEKEFSLLRERSYTPILIELTYKRQLMLVMMDFFLIGFAYYLSYRLRFDAEYFPFYFRIFLKSLPAVIACKFIAFFSFGVYRAIWGFLGLDDILVYLKASVIASIFSVVAVTFIYRFEDFSKGVFIIDWLFTTGYLLGTRGSFRLFMDTMKRRTLSGQAVLIYGAGRGGEILLREILHNHQLNIKPLGFIDDDPIKSGKKLQGYPILGTSSDLTRLAGKHKVNGLLVSFRPEQEPELNDNLDSVMRYCRKNGLFLKQFSVSLEDMDIRP